ncbi:hypothetical protein DSO57_1033749 [Entomophthora muscae]|uniref:Uncharacterized protein n=1 Tax=Entomophthora muscae TaxID=34485 RepID=A0ACC2RQZ2_9FUNG|nr:hypothetical protein DSO57_1033749 [Entomophthora muscae]
MIFLGLLSMVSGLVCPGSKQVCLDITPQGSVFQFNISGPPQPGYMAIGIGESMSKADIFIAWFDNEGKPKVSYRTSSGFVEPVMHKGSFDIVANNSNQRFIAFTAPLPQPEGFATLDTKGPNRMIWAYSPQTPGKDGHIAFHKDKGEFIYPFQGDSPVDISPAIPSYLIWHGALMIIAWLVLPPISIFIARFLKDHLGVLWFKLHRGLFILVGLIAFSSIFLVYHNQGAALSNPHAIIGSLVMLLYVGQAILGYIIDKLWNPENPKAPWHDKLHWWAGRSISLLALGNIIYGIVLLENPIGFWIPTVLIIVVSVFAFVVGEKKIGKISHYNQIQGE